MRIDIPICSHKECKDICRHYLIDGNCGLNVDIKKSSPPCERTIEKIMDIWIYEQGGSGEDGA